MGHDYSRRAFLRNTSVGGAVAGLGDLSFLGRLQNVSAAEVAPKPHMVQFGPDIEPLVRFLEETPRNRLLEETADRLRKGTSYRELLAALQLAGIRNVQPRPSVGFKFHSVLVVNSAHLAAMDSPDEHRWLPIFWALDYFKDSQARDEREGNWTMAAVDESAVPSPERARSLFTEAMDSWDESKADVAAAGLVRTAGEHELFETFCRYGARDFRSIGHKAIFVANAWRTLQTIGRQHAEPIMRSLAYALLNHEGAGNPAENDYEADRPWRDNVKRAAKIRKPWQAGRIDAEATRDLLTTLYDGSPADACEQVVELLNREVDPQSVWDALFVGSGELLMRQPGIVGLHAVTTTNALRYAYDTAAGDDTRKMMLLQNAAFLPMFRASMESRGKVQAAKLKDLTTTDEDRKGKSKNKGEKHDVEAAVDRIFATLGQDPTAAARQTAEFVRNDGDIRQFVDAARLLVFMKGRDTHDYKFSSAVLEDYLRVTPEWRDSYLASSVFNLRSSTASDNPLVQRTRQALQG